MINTENNLPLMEVLEKEQILVITCNKEKLSFFFRMFDPEFWDDNYDHDDFGTSVGFDEKPCYENSKVIVYMQINHIDIEKQNIQFDVRFDTNCIWVFFNMAGLKYFNTKLEELKNGNHKALSIKTYASELDDNSEYGIFIPEIRIELL